MHSLRRRGAIALAAFSLVAAGPAASVHADPGLPQAVAAKSCTSGYTHASLSWGHKCLRAGQFCTRGASANRQYHRYGYHCRGSGRLTDY